MLTTQLEPQLFASQLHGALEFRGGGGGEDVGEKEAERKREGERKDRGQKEEESEKIEEGSK